MCGRYAISEEEPNARVRAVMAEVIERMAASPELVSWRPGEVAPTCLAPVVLMSEAGGVARLLRWGFPHPQGSGVVFNARRETLRVKPMFRALVARYRCLVPADCFYEWAPVPGVKKKAKYSIAPTQVPLVMAGLFGAFRGPDGSVSEAFTIVTTAAEGAVAEIHDRMPMMLDEETSALWMDRGAPPEVLDAFPSVTDVIIRRAS